MQVADDQKRENILRAAAQLFATQPFHKVLLSEVAEKASVGKGTLYIYFKNKDHLYLSVLFSGFSSLVSCLHEQIGQDQKTPMANLEMVIDEIVNFAFQNPCFFEVMRTTPMLESLIHEKWTAKRQELKDLIESVIVDGIRKGDFVDTNPGLTARYIPGLVRSALIYGTDGLDRKAISKHIVHFVRSGIRS